MPPKSVKLRHYSLSWQNSVYFAKILPEIRFFLHKHCLHVCMFYISAPEFLKPARGTFRRLEFHCYDRTLVYLYNKDMLLKIISFYPEGQAKFTWILKSHHCIGSKVTLFWWMCELSLLVELHWEGLRSTGLPRLVIYKDPLPSYT